MSMSTHVEALRPVFTSCFKSAAAGLSAAGQIDLLGDELKAASQMLVSELLREWYTANNLTARLPEEVLALCFALLPFRDRVFASHVSRRWRSISLENPAIWAYIGSDLPRRRKPELFAMALERTCNRPADVLDCPDRNDVIEGLLVRHMHHIRSLYYPRVLHLAPLSRAAPRLETLGSNARSALDIRNDFLGGAVGRLRKLQLRVVSFPETCPALSTVTELFLHGPISFCNAMSFSQLFQLFPVVQSLTLLDLKRKFSEYLPVGPPPASLRYLNLATTDGEYDLTQLYAAWRSDRTAHVEISHNAVLSEHLVNLVDRADKLEVLRAPDDEASAIAATGRGARYRRLEYWEPAADQHVLAARLANLSRALHSVHTLSVPATSLTSFLPVVATLPKLARLVLTVTIDGNYDGPEQRAARWAVLAPLARLEHRGKLESLVLHVVCIVRQRREPSAHDANALLTQLAALAPVRTPLPDITISGFSPAVLRDVVPPAFPGFRVVFGCTDAPPPALWV